jgi:polar amino acid transport system substrate-binding protein
MDSSDMNERPFRSHAGLSAVFLLATIFIVGDGGRTTGAQTCGTDYVIRENETLRDIAQRAYGDPQQWSVIYYANGDKLGSNATLLVPGLSIRIPCIGQKPAERAAASPPAPAQPAAPPSSAGTIELSSLVRRIEFLTADGAEPFTGRSLLNGGMLTDMLSASMKLVKDQSKGGFDYGISWVNDWGAHLNPLLVSRAFDAGFPWTKPDCDNLSALDQESRYRCQKFFFSDPLSEVLTVLFVKKGSGFLFAADSDVVGKKLCQPSGSSVYDLDKGGRNWLKEGKITLLQPKSIEECFRWLDADTVDAVVASELVGRMQVNALRMSDRVQALDRPLAVGALHAVVAKTHPYARTILYYINGSIAQLHESGDYDRIAEAHLTLFWDAQERDGQAPPAPTADKGAGNVTQQPPATGSVPPTAKKPAAPSELAKQTKK